jgi:hypothetical protein
MRFATNCATAYARASAPTRRRFKQAVFTRLDVARRQDRRCQVLPALRPALFYERV